MDQFDENKNFKEGADNKLNISPERFTSSDEEEDLVDYYNQINDSEAGDDDIDIHYDQLDELSMDEICRRKCSSEDDYSGSEDAISDAHDSDDECVPINTQGVGGWRNMVDKLPYFEVHDVMKLEFESIEDAQEFYESYSKMIGFGIRKRDVKYEKKDHRVLYRLWVCSNEGFRINTKINKDPKNKKERKITAATRFGCDALFRVRLSRKSNKYIVTDFVPGHNHELVSAECVPLIRCHNKISDGDAAFVGTLHDVGMKPTQIMDQMAEQAGGHANIGINEKQLYNMLAARHRKQTQNGEANTALYYLEGRKMSDPDFFYSYDVDQDNRLCRLYWSDSKSRKDYKLFGDVVAFDSTYRINAYNKPLVVLVGVNNHFNTIVFGAAIISDESFETYEWVLKNFVRAMDKKTPPSIITDGDASMRKAIKEVLPMSSHRLCRWHLNRNCMSKVKSKQFLSGFKRLMRKRCSKEDFDECWDELVNECDMLENSWVRKAYKRRELWAESYLEGHFFAGMASTQRCEKMNSVLKNSLTSRFKLCKFMKRFDIAMSKMRFKELRAKFRTKHSEPVMVTHIRSIEQHAADIYTQNIFYFVQQHIANEKCFRVFGIEDIENNVKVFRIGKSDNSGRMWNVTCDTSMEFVQCSCRKFESAGLPCSHIFVVLKSLQRSEIPSCCIHKRWTKTVNMEEKELGIGRQLEGSSSQLARYGVLRSASNNLCFHASQSDEDYSACLKDISKLMEKFQKKSSVQSIDCHDINFDVNDPEVHVRKVKDSNVGKKRKNKCGLCQSYGHNRTTCNKRTNRGVDVETLVSNDGSRSNGGSV